ncbi:hypothetical protein ACB092_04G199700 [Castanea dentata]
MGGLFSDQSKKETPGRPAERHIGGPKFEPCSAVIHKFSMQQDAPDEQLKELLERAIAKAAMRRALEAADGDEILAIKMLLFVEGERAGNDTNTKQWQPDEQQVQKLVEMGFAEAAVRSALEAVNGDEILAIKMLRFAEHARVGNYRFSLNV